jgi:hypothetical protein
MPGGVHHDLIPSLDRFRQIGPQVDDNTCVSNAYLLSKLGGHRSEGHALSRFRCVAVNSLRPCVMILTIVVAGAPHRHCRATPAAPLRRQPGSALASFCRFRIRR